MATQTKACDHCGKDFEWEDGFDVYDNDLRSCPHCGFKYHVEQDSSYTEDIGTSCWWWLEALPNQPKE